MKLNFLPFVPSFPFTKLACKSIPDPNLSWPQTHELYLLLEIEESALFGPSTHGNLPLPFPLHKLSP